MTAPDLAERVRRSRERQGLPPKITDPATLAKVATLLDAGLDSDDAPAVGTPGRRSDHPAAVTQQKVRSDGTP
jgi:hypothetical protein